MDGTCKDLCSSQERQERLYSSTVSTVELEHSERPGWTSKHLMVKKFQRSAAGLDAAHHSEVRPPSVLLETVRYLCSHVIDLDLLQHDDPRWRDDRRKSSSKPVFAGDLEFFLRDRLRSVAKDLALQSYSADGRRTHPDAISCLETIVRFHIIVSHDCCESDPANFDPKMNWSSLSGFVASLDQLYKLARLQQPAAVADVWCQHEPTMRAYMLLAMLPAPLRMWKTASETQLDSIRASSRIQGWLTELAQCATSKQVFANETFATALSVCHACLSGDYGAFFGIVRSCRDVLFVSVMHAQFDRMRLRALQCVNSVYRVCTLETLAETLCCENLAHAQTICDTAGMDVQPSSSGVMRVTLDSKVEIPTARSAEVLGRLICRKSRLVEELRRHQTRGSIVLAARAGGKKNKALTSRITASTTSTTSSRSSDVHVVQKHNSATAAALSAPRASSESKHREQKTGKTSQKTGKISQRSPMTSSLSSEIMLTDIEKLGSMIIIEIRNVENPPGRAFIFKDDSTKARPRKNRRQRQTYVCRMTEQDARQYEVASSSNKGLILAVERKYLAMHANALRTREHRLALSVLQASSVPNAAVAVVCGAAHAKQVCGLFQSRASEAVIGLVAVPLQTKKNGKVSVERRDVMDAWMRHPLTGGEKGIEINMGHHLLHMLELISQEVSALQSEGRLPKSPLRLILIAQRKKSGRKKSVKLDCPGGKRHLGETSEECAVREVNEEVGFALLSHDQKFLVSRSLDETMLGFVVHVDN